MRRFVPHWDVLLLELLHACPTPSRAVLTSYPPPYELPDRLSEEKRPPLFVASAFDADGMLRLAGKTLARQPPPTTPLPTLFCAAGFSFASANTLQYDCLASPLASPFTHAPSQRSAL